MTEEEIKELAQASADKAVRQTFRMFGVDTDDQDSVNEFRHDLVWAREMRQSVKGVQSKMLLVLAGLVVAGVFTAAMKGAGIDGK